MPAGSFPDITGKVVDVNGDPVQGVRVSARDVDSRETVLSSDRTNDRGRFRLAAIPSEEVGLKVNGSSVGFETGWMSCFREAAGVYQVVATWGAACSHAPGPLEGPVRVDATP